MKGKFPILGLLFNSHKGQHLADNPMTKAEAIEQAKAELAKTGVTQIVTRRGDNYNSVPTTAVLPRGHRPAEMISTGNVHNY